MKNILKLSFIPLDTDLGLLFIRIWFAFGLFFRHGFEKFTRFPHMLGHFPDPLHVGPVIGLSFALITDGICTLLIILGFGTRLAALLLTINLLVVFAFIHGLSIMKDHAELVYSYLGLSVFIVIAGPGKYSLDKKLLS